METKEKKTIDRNKILLISAIAAGVLIVATVILLLVKGLPKMVNNDNVSSEESTQSLTSSEMNETNSSFKPSTSSKVANTGVSSNVSKPVNNSVKEPASSQENTQQEANTIASTEPTITTTKMVGPDICIVVGSCAKGTEKVVITGDNVEKTTVIPYAGGLYDYFITQVKCKDEGYVNAVAYEKGKSPSEAAMQYIFYEKLDENLMTRDEYRPVIGKNGFGHFYSALVGYSQSTEKLDSSFKTVAKSNIMNIVNAAKNVGAEPIFFIIPSSAEIYPETLPSGYTKTKGESLYKAFYDIATSCGAKVIYPIDTMKKHKNDKEGYQLYQHTDSHWSTYGAYWGTYDLFTYISKKFPNAKPRTLSQMDFYTREFFAGDNLFNLGLDSSTNNLTFKTNTSQMRELTTLYNFSIFSDTLRATYHNYSALYLSESATPAKVTVNPKGNGLPTAVIMRDSFSKVAFDIVSDRFNKIYWQECNTYNLPLEDLERADPDYLICFYSERNLLKIMLNNKDATILNLQ